ncbi:MAG: hypothetical protein ACPLXM_06980 [Bacteroidales bacterium]
MKDTVITARQKKIELRIILICYALANLFNVWGILRFHTSWKEIFTAQLWVLAVAGFMYALVWVVRLIWWIIRYLAKRPRA